MGEKKRRIEARSSEPIAPPPKAIPASTLIRLGEEACAVAASRKRPFE